MKKFIYSDIENHHPINLAKVKSLAKSDRNGELSISFFYDGGWTSWEFSEEEERDRVYENIQSLDCMINVSNIVKL